MKFQAIDILRVSPLQRAAKGLDVVRLFDAHPEIPGCVIVDQDNLPIAYIDRLSFVTKISAIYGRALYDNRPAELLSSQNYRLVSIYDEVGANLGFDTSGQELDRATGLIITDKAGRYLGVTTALALTQALLEDNQTLIGELKKEVVERKAAEDRVRRLAESDPLTGLYNRRAFLGLLSQRLVAGQSTLLCFIDLDRFKTINDVHGHGVGDFVLKMVGQRLLEAENPIAAARIGGDEFALIYEADGDESTIAHEMNTILLAICEPMMTSGGLLDVGASIGIAHAPGQYRDQESLIDAADRAMLRAKSNGGGYSIAHNRIEADYSYDAETRVELHHAVMEGRIKPVFQPIYCLLTHTIAGHEVLARWPGEGDRPERSPDYFIPAAERLGLIEPLFWSVVDQAFEAYQASSAEGFLSVNISPLQLQASSFTERFMALINAHSLTPQDIEIEITETAIIKDTATTRETLSALSEQGIRIALDDFGTGYSSLSLIREFPIDKLKIDKSFLQSGQRGQTADKIVAATLGLCQALGLESCAEGVETQAMADHLATIGCDFAQGFYFSHPRSALPWTGASEAFAKRA